MSDPTLSDIDFENKMVWVWTTLNFSKPRVVGSVLRPATDNINMKLNDVLG